MNKVFLFHQTDAYMVSFMEPQKRTSTKSMKATREKNGIE